MTDNSHKQNVYNVHHFRVLRRVLCKQRKSEKHAAELVSYVYQIFADFHNSFTSLREICDSGY